MMGEAIRVILTGVCTFVGANVGNNNRPLTAVFPNASHHEPKHHVSMIVAYDDFVVETDLGSTLLYSESGRPYSVVLLDGKSLALAGVVDKELVLARPPLGRVATDEHYPTTLEELESVEWIPSLGRSWPRMFPLRAARRMQRGFYSTVVDRQLVSSFLELPNGYLASHWVSGDIWEFSPRTRTRRAYRTAIAQEVRLDADIATEVLHFDVCELETRKHCGYIRIRRRDPTDTTERITAVIANVPDEDRLPGSIVFCGECGRSECIRRDDPFPCTCVDHHYANYYRAMSSKLPARPSLPRRYDSRPPIIPMAMRVGGGNCAPSEYP